MAIAQVSVVPLGTGTTSVSAYVGEIIRWLDDHGVKYQLTPMGTVLEGQVDEILSIVGRMHEIPFKQGAARVLTMMNIDDRRDIQASAKGKVEAVMKHLGKEGKHRP